MPHGLTVLADVVVDEWEVKLEFDIIVRDLPRRRLKPRREVLRADDDEPHPALLERINLHPRLVVRIVLLPEDPVVRDVVVLPAEVEVEVVDVAHDVPELGELHARPDFPRVLLLVNGQWEQEEDLLEAPLAWLEPANNGEVHAWETFEWS